MASSPLAKATEVAQLPLVHNNQIEGVRQYASSLFLTPDFIGLLMDLNVAKVSFRHVSKFEGGGKLACAGGGGGRWSPFPGPPPLLGSRDGALKKVIDGGK